MRCISRSNAHHYVQMLLDEKLVWCENARQRTHNLGGTLEGCQRTVLGAKPTCSMLQHIAAHVDVIGS